jgi:hypothetical protein
VPGNYSFFLNYFTDIPQLRGALYQSEVHPWPEHIYYQVTNGVDPEISLAWLKIANIGWLVYGGPRELFRDFKVPSDKFDTTLEKIEETHGDIFYKVPLKNASLAKTVPQTIVDVSVPVNAIDREPIELYIEHLEASNNELELEEKGGAYTITGDVDEGELILVQSTYVSGWKATTTNGRPLKVTSDPLGFILISPASNGAQQITLRYRTPLSVYVFRLVTVLTIGFMIWYVFRKPKEVDHVFP